jgi:hypothetical protein
MHQNRGPAGRANSGRAQAVWLAAALNGVGRGRRCTRPTWIGCVPRTRHSRALQLFVRAADVALTLLPELLSDVGTSVLRGQQRQHCACQPVHAPAHHGCITATLERLEPDHCVVPLVHWLLAGGPRLTISSWARAATALAGRRSYAGVRGRARSAMCTLRARTSTSSTRPTPTAACPCTRAALVARARALVCRSHQAQSPRQLHNVRAREERRRCAPRPPSWVTLTRSVRQAQDEREQRPWCTSCAIACRTSATALGHARRYLAAQLRMYASQ